MYNQEIVKRVANADLKAFRKMYIDCAPAVYDCAYDILHDVVRANMVVSRTFVDIFNFLPQLKKIRLFDEWVYRLTVYHADNIALEDFIRGSEKLETIWHDIIGELGTAGERDAPTPPASPQNAARREEQSMNVQAEETQALYSRLRAIEEEADKIQLQHAGPKQEDQNKQQHSANQEDQINLQPAESKQKEPVLSINEFEGQKAELVRENNALDEEWTPILFPTDDERDAELHFHHVEKSSTLKAYRKTVLVPSSMVFGAIKRELNETPGKESDSPAASEPVLAEEAAAESMDGAMHEQTAEREAETAPSQEPAPTADREAAIEVNDYASGLRDKSAAMGEKFERFRAYMNETRTAEKATAPPPAEEQEHTHYDRPSELSLDELQKRVSHEEEGNVANLSRLRSAPRPKKNSGRTVAIVLGAAIAAVLILLVLMAYGVLLTPAFLAGIVSGLTKGLQGLFAGS